MIPLNLSSLMSHRQLLNLCGASCPPTVTSDDRTQCRPNAAATGEGGGGGRARARRVRFADDEMGGKLTRKRREYQRESSNRKRQRTEADENKRDNTMDTQLSNFDWSDSTHPLRSTTTPMMKTTPTFAKSDDYDDTEDSLSSLHLSATKHGRKQFPSIPIPHDPRLWSRLDVYNWLEHMKSLEVDLGDLDTARFLMNGKALCLMTPAMFIYRVPHGGRILYKDFQTRLSWAVAEVHHKKCISS